MVGTAAGSKGTVRQARRVQPVLYECGPHFGCPDGPKCNQAATLMVNALLALPCLLLLVSVFLLLVFCRDFADVPMCSFLCPGTQV